MEIYLNVAEWGPSGQFGAEAGARRAFRTSAADLDARQAALMAAMLPNPRRRDAQKPGPAVRRLAGIYQRRANNAGLDACLRRAPRVVRAGVPRRRPLVTIGGRGSFGMPFLLTMMPADSSHFSASAPVRSASRVRRSTSMRWLSVPPEQSR